MMNILLYTDAQNTLPEMLGWGFGIVLLLFLVWAIYHQRKSGKRLHEELEELEKVRQNNIEYDFVLKAMKIAVWRYDATTKAFSYESDYREGQKSYVPAADETFTETLAAIAPGDIDRVNQAFADICEGRSDYL